MEPEPKRQREAKDSRLERSVDAPSAVWWMLAILAIIGFSALAFVFGRAT